MYLISKLTVTSGHDTYGAAWGFGIPQHLYPATSRSDLFATQGHFPLLPILIPYASTFLMPLLAWLFLFPMGWAQTACLGGSLQGLPGSKRSQGISLTPFAYICNKIAAYESSIEFISGICRVIIEYMAIIQDFTYAAGTLSFCLRRLMKKGILWPVFSVFHTLLYYLWIRISCSKSLEHFKCSTYAKIKTTMADTWRFRSMHMHKNQMLNVNEKNEKRNCTYYFMIVVKGILMYQFEIQLFLDINCEK